MAHFSTRSELRGGLEVVVSLLRKIAGLTIVGRYSWMGFAQQVGIVFGVYGSRGAIVSRLIPQGSLALIHQSSEDSFLKQIL